MDERRPPRVLWWVVQVGFLTFFGVVAVLFGLYFGVELLRTQREGVVSINQIRDVETAQAQQLAELNQRLETQNDELRVQGEQLQALTRLLAAGRSP